MKWFSAALALILMGVTPVFAQEEQEDEACDGVIFLAGYAAAPEPENGAAYGLLLNAGSEDVVLTEVTSEAADEAALFEMTMDGEAVVANPLAEPITVAAGQFVEFEPNGKYVLLEGLSEELDEALPLTLVFEDGTTLDAELPLVEGVDSETANLAEPAMTGTCSGVHIFDTWARPSVAMMGAAYGLVVNFTDEAVVLMGGSTGVADFVEVHDMTIVDDVMQMNPMTDGLTLLPGGYALLQPGGLHIMLINLTGELVEGEAFDLDLHFAEGDDLSVNIPIHDREMEAMEMDHQ
jgi:periplasmic copper chaperone A